MMNESYLAKVADHIYKFDQIIGFCGRDIPFDAMKRIVKIVLVFELNRLREIVEEETP